MRKVRIWVLLMLGALLLSSACAPGAPAPTAAPPSPTAAPKQAAPAPTATASPATATPKPAAVAPTATPASPKPAAITVKQSMTSATSSDAGILLANQKGYFAEQGITLEVTQHASGADVISAISAGQVDIAGGAFSLAHANAVLRGIALKMVADKFSKQPGPFSSYRINYRKDLYDSGQLKEVAQLKGKKIAVSSVAAMGALVAPTLKLANLTVKDVELVPMGFPDMVAALANKSVDAAVLAEPLLTRAVDQGIVVRGRDTFDVDPVPSTSGIFFSPQFSQNTDAGNRYVLAYLKGVRDYNDAFLKNKGTKEVIEALAKAQGIDDLTLYGKMDKVGLNPDGYIDRKSMEASIDYWMSTGELKEKIDLEKFIDHRYVDNAIQKLGKYVR